MASDVRKLLDQIKQEYQASRSGLSGSAMVARHDFIQQRTANMANATNQLVSLVGADRAAMLADLTMDVVDLELQLFPPRFIGSGKDFSQECSPGLLKCTLDTG